MVAEPIPARETIVTILCEAKRLLLEKGWTRFATARNAEGAPCGLNSDDARQFDLAGALTRAVGAADPSHKEFYFGFFQLACAEALQRNYRWMDTYTRWNDHGARNSEDVVALIEAVIAAVRTAPL